MASFGVLKLISAKIKRVMKKIFALLIFSTFALVLISCASAKKEPNVSAAAIESQYYFIDNGMPVRELKDDQKFFFKKCNVDNSGPYPAKTNYDCNEP